jgi:hypothetical protein
MRKGERKWVPKRSLLFFAEKRKTRFFVEGIFFLKYARGG